MKHRTIWKTCTLAMLGILALPAAPVLADDLQFRSQTFFGGTDLEQGTGISVVNGGSVSSIYLSGLSPSTISPFGYEGIGLKYTLNAGSFTPQFQWNRSFPGVVGEDQFSGVTANATSAYFSGYSFSRTSDTVGDKEIKGIVVNIPSNGVGTTWERQTPAAPGAFSYGGSERLQGISDGLRSGQPVLYAAGQAQSGFSNGGRLFLSQLDLNGNVLWTRTDTVANPFSVGNAVTSTGEFVFVAGATSDSGQPRAFVRRYDSLGNLAWSNTSNPGTLNAIKYDAVTNSIFLAGKTNGATPDFLLERWDLNGNLVWSRTFDRSGGLDILNGLGISNGVYIAAGSTTGQTAGGQDGIVLQFDPSTGDMINSALWGGGLNDSFSGIAFQNDIMHLVGSTDSFGAGGSDAAYVVFQVAAVPEPSTILLTSVSALGFGIYLWRRKRQQREWA